MQLSVVIITLNEERDLARCLASVKAVADEVVVVDSFSTDGTERIAREHGACFVPHAFEGHIEQKNWALTQASHAWVLSLDADEALSEDLARSIEVLKQGAGADGYTMNRSTNYCGRWIRHGGWYPDRKLRLWDHRKGRWGGTNPHDRFELDAGARIEHLSGDILHYGFYTVAEHRSQAEAFARIAAKALHTKGRRASILQAALSAFVRFVQGYFLRAGFLDGIAGFKIAWISAGAKWKKYTWLSRLNQGPA